MLKIHPHTKTLRFLTKMNRIINFGVGIKRTIIPLMVLILFSSICLAADVSFPYINGRLKFPNSQDPFPGLGNYYTSLSQGMATTLWNPASLGKLKTTSLSLGISSASNPGSYQRTVNVNEISETMQINGSDAGTFGIFFRPLSSIGSGINTREVEIQTVSRYKSENAGLDFSSAIRVNDWLSFGIATNNPLEVGFDTAGDFPTVARTVTNFYGQTIDQMQINNDGKLTYTFDGGGSPVTYESVSSLWSGFLSQEATIPLTSISNMTNSYNLESPYRATGAINLDKLYLGLSLIPISATANINNNVVSMVNSDTEDQFLYVPNFNPNNEADLVSWINDQDKYGTSNGYKRKQLLTHAGEIVGTTTYRGFYSASTTRFDFGGMYDVNDWLSFGVALENFGGANLNFQGNSIASYVTYRDVNTSETENIENIFQPGGNTTLDLLTDQWVTTDEVSDTKLILESQKNYQLPKKTRIGLTLKRPFLIAVDYEQNSNQIKYSYQENSLDKEITISNINYLRLGFEFHIFSKWRVGTTLMFKPTVTGLTTEAQDSLNSAFSFGALPVKFDMGNEFSAWGVTIANSFGFNAQSIINYLQFDHLNVDLSKIVYINSSVSKGDWKFYYLLQVDPLATANAYGNKTPAAGQDKSFEMSDLRYLQTVGATYAF